MARDEIHHGSAVEETEQSAKDVAKEHVRVLKVQRRASALES